MNVEIDKLNQIENGCVIVIRNEYEDDSYFLVLKDYVSSSWYLINVLGNVIIAEYNSLETLKRNLMDDYHIVRIVSSDNVILKLKE